MANFKNIILNPLNFFKYSPIEKIKINGIIIRIERIKYHFELWFQWQFLGAVT